jgi:hypothetical protein
METVNTNELNKHSIVTGKKNKYFPIGIAYSDTVLTTDLENVILVYCYFGLMKNRYFDRVEFYKKLSAYDFNNIDKSPLVYILKSSKEDSEAILLDLKASPLFKQ